MVTSFKIFPSIISEYFWLDDLHILKFIPFTIPKGYTMFVITCVCNNKDRHLLLQAVWDIIDFCTENFTFSSIFDGSFSYSGTNRLDFLKLEQPKISPDCDNNFSVGTTLCILGY